MIWLIRRDVIFLVLDYKWNGMTNMLVVLFRDEIPSWCRGLSWAWFGESMSFLWASNPIWYPWFVMNKKIIWSFVNQHQDLPIKHASSLFLEQYSCLIKNVFWNSFPTTKVFMKILSTVCICIIHKRLLVEQIRIEVICHTYFYTMRHFCSYTKYYVEIAFPSITFE